MILKDPPPTQEEINLFLNSIGFNLPNEIINFYKLANGANIDTGNNFIIIWPLTELIDKNKNYEIDKYIPGFFVFGSSGGGEAYGIKKSSGEIFIIPFSNMDWEDAIYKYKDFKDLLEAAG